VKTEVRKRVLADLTTVDACGVNGFCKLFIYEFFVVRRVSWQFLVHDFCLSFAVELDKLAIPFLKRWAGLFRGADVGCLFRLRKDLGLQLTSFTFHFKHLQLVRCCLLKHSTDPAVAGAYILKTSRESSFSRTWCATSELETLGPAVEHEIRFGGQNSHEGLGHGRYIAAPTLRQRRGLLVELLLEESEKALVEHSSNLARQGVWTKWQGVRPFDFSWKNLLSGPGPRLLSFVLNSLINSVRTPDMLRLWNYKRTAECPLCFAPLCTLHHELVGCPIALHQGRYSWRHDSVLANIESALEGLLRRLRSRASRLSLLKQSFSTSFVKHGTHATSKVPSSSCLDGSTDWCMVVDYKHKPVVFPPCIFATSERPDIVLWSESSRRVELLELTCPAEEGIEAARDRKEGKYATLITDINNTRCWTANLQTIEIGARGLVACRTFKLFRSFGFEAREANALCRSLSIVASRCSFAIHCAHQLGAWVPRGLVHVPPVVVPENRFFKHTRHVGKSIDPKPPSVSLPHSVVCTPDPSSLLPTESHGLLVKNGVLKLYHFTDRSCVPSIQKHGLKSWVGLNKEGIEGKKGSSSLSRLLDNKKGLGDYVRLSFTSRHPMMYVALKERRIEDAVVLEVDLDVVLQSGTLYSDSNAASASAIISGNPSVVRFDIVLCESLFEVPSGLRSFYQAEVLIPSQVAPTFIHFPSGSPIPTPLPPPLVSPVTPPSLPVHVLPPPPPPPFSSGVLDPRGVWCRFSTGLVLWGKRSRSSFSSLAWREAKPSASFWQKTGPNSGFWQETNHNSSQGWTCPKYGVRGDDDIIAAWEAVNRASIIATRKGDFESACILLHALPQLPTPPTTSPPILIEDVPPVTTCEFHVGPEPPSCANCVPGLFFCSVHEVLCGAEAHIVCNLCKRTLCAEHLYCSCADSQALRAEVSRRHVNDT
jgi:hypothetical protein